MSLGKVHEPDRIFLLTAVTLFVAGAIILASASVPLAQHEHGNAMYYLLRQLTLGGAAGIIVAFLVQVVSLAWIRAFAAPLFFLTVVLLFAVLIPGIGVGSGGAVRWIQAGPVTIQPGELAKVTLPLYLAVWFASHVSIAGSGRTGGRSRRAHLGAIEKGEGEVLLPFFFIMGLVGIPLLLQPDLSTFGVLAFTALFMFFLAGASWRALTILLGSGFAALLILIRLAPYRMNRILAFTDPQSDPLGIGYQVNQALLAVGSGGLFGRGLGFSREKLFYLPEPMGDSIFAVFAEETGFFGSALLVLLFLLFCWRGLVLVRRLPDPFTQLFAAGLVGWIVAQAFLNIGGNIALLPLVGITLPFVSYGSASLAMALLSVGLVYKMSRYTRV